MNQVWLVVVIPIVLSLLVNEVCDLSPWLAQKIVRRSAQLWALGNPDRAEELAEEWAALINDTPGKLTKLFQALRFFAGAAWRFQHWRLANKLAPLLVQAAQWLERRALRDPSSADSVQAMVEALKEQGWTSYSEDHRRRLLAELVRNDAQVIHFRSHGDHTGRTIPVLTSKNWPHGQIRPEDLKGDN